MSKVQIESKKQGRRKRRQRHIARHPKFPARSHRVNQPAQPVAKPNLSAPVTLPPAERTVTANIPPAAQVATPAPTADEALAADLALPIEELDLTVRSYNVLDREGIKTIGELVGYSRLDLLDMVRLGEKSVDHDIVPKLAGMGLSLKEDSPDQS